MHLFIAISYFAALSYALVVSTDVVKRIAGPGDPDGCIWASKYLPWTYMDCYYSDATVAKVDFINYTIRLTGTGQDPSIWCDSFYNHLVNDCDLQYTAGDNKCNIFSVLTRTEALDGDRQWSATPVLGLEMMFMITSALPLGDYIPLCVAKAVRNATCAAVEIANGSHCSVDGFGDESVLEFEQSF